jgi:hypothetical protein
MSTVLKRSFDDQLWDGVSEYLKTHPNATELDKDEIARWLIHNKSYQLEKQQRQKFFAKKVARLLGKRKVRGQDGKPVSEFHAATCIDGKKKQKTLWAHRLKMTSSFAHTSFEQRQKQAEGFCRSMHNDATDVNANNPNLKDNPVQLELNYSYVKGDAEPRKVQTLPDLSAITQTPATSPPKKRRKKQLPGEGAASGAKTEVGRKLTTGKPR